MSKEQKNLMPVGDSSKTLLGFLCVLAASFAIFNMWRLSEQLATGIWGIDFLWRSINLLANRENPYEVFLAEIKSGISRPGTPNYPISGLLSLTPLAFFTEHQARWIWFVMNMVFAAGIVAIMQKSYPLPRTIFLIALGLFIGCAPLRVVLLNSQTTLYVMLLFLLANYASRRFPCLAGILLALSLMKYSVTLPLVIWFGLNRSRLKTIPWAIAWQLALITVGALWMRSDFINALLGPIRLTNAGGVAMSSVATDLFSISHHAGIESLAIPAIIALGLLPIIYVLLLSRRIGPDIQHLVSSPALEDLATLGFLCVLSCLMFFHLAYDHVVLLPMLWWGLHLLAVKLENKRLGLAVLCMVMVLWVPREMLSRIADLASFFVDTSKLWWGMGLPELLRFAALSGLLILAISRVAGPPSLQRIRTALDF